MGHLVLVLASIVLLALALTAGMNNINFEKVDEIEDVILIKSAISQVEGAVSGYMLLNGHLPLNLPAIIPSFTDQPKLPDGLDISSIDIKANGDQFFCFSSLETSDSDYRTFLAVQNDLGASRMYINNSCGSTINMEVPESFPVATYLTYFTG